MEIILEGIDFSTLQEIHNSHNKNIKGLYLDKESDLYDLYLSNVQYVKTYDNFTIVKLQSCPILILLRNNEYIRIVIQ